MKRLILTSIIIVTTISTYGQTSQDVMVIEKKDGTTLKVKVDDIQRTIFESIYTNPTGEIATAVDLGLPSGVKWASWNLGASAPEEYGGYYGWGDETGLNTSTNVNEYPSANPPTDICGTQYDIAKALWGDQWRLPTYDDIKELYEQCQFYKSGNNIEAVGPNKNSIILPLAGSREETEIFDTANYGYYWAGSLYQDDKTNAWLLNFDMANGKYGLAGGSRYYGLSIRPVYGKPITVSVTTGNAEGITETSAVINGAVSGVSSVITVGIIYGTSSNLSSISGTKKSTTSNSSYSITLSGLSSGTTYYYCAYAIINEKSYYGTIKSFKTQEAISTGTLNGHDWVDLGLPSGIKWATNNLGAEKQEYYGWHVAWGETTKKSTYSWENYKYGNKVSGIIYLSKYNCRSDGTVDNKKELDLSDDAARANWGSTWRMPTKDEMIELYENCAWEWTTTNGINGYNVKSRVNNNSIFLPAAGLWADSFDDQSAGKGYYWTSSLDDGIFAYCLSFSQNGIDSPEDSPTPRCLGYSIRPVTE